MLINVLPLIQTANLTNFTVMTAASDFVTVTETAQQKLNAQDRPYDWEPSFSPPSPSPSHWQSLLQCNNQTVNDRVAHSKNPFACEKKRFSCQHKSARITWPLIVTLTLTTPWMHADLESILWKFGGDPAICLREKAICAKVYRRTDRRMDRRMDRRRTPRHCISSFLEWAKNHSVTISTLHLHINIPWHAVSVSWQRDWNKMGKNTHREKHKPKLQARPKEF